MPKFGQIKFAEAQYSDKDVPAETRNVMYGTRQLGTRVRGSINDKVTYRVRTGLNNYGAKFGRPIQDKYKYNVPSSINNIESASARAALTTAVSNWKNVLTSEEKAVLNERARKKRFMSGYNLYVGEYIKANA